MDHWLERLGIRFQHNLIFMGGVRSLGRGDLEGIRFFLDRKVADHQRGQQDQQQEQPPSFSLALRLPFFATETNQLAAGGCVPSFKNWSMSACSS